MQQSFLHALEYIAGLNKQLGLSNELFVLGDSLVLTVLGQVSFMPILVLAARLCPEVRISPSLFKIGCHAKLSCSEKLSTPLNRLPSNAIITYGLDSPLLVSW